MMRAPRFRFYAAHSVDDAAAALADEPNAMLLAGGTDLLPKLKRRQRTPELIVSLRRVHALCGIETNGELAIGATTTLSGIASDPRVREYHALFRAVSQIATPLIRNTATIGGNLALDTRCNYYDQSEEWRGAIGGCMKGPLWSAEATPPLFKPAPESGGVGTCWVAPSSPRCWAVSSTDAAPALIALGARVTLVSRSGEREIPLQDLYRDDGIEPLAKQRDEILTNIRVPIGWRSTYWKLRRRGSIDFPVLGVAVAIRFAGKVIEDARVVLGAVASRPLLVPESQSLAGRQLTDDVIEEFAERAAAHAKPLDNTDFSMTWRKTVARTFVSRALREISGGNR